MSSTEDHRDVVRRNRAAVADELGVDFAHGLQVHGTHVARAAAPVDLAAAPPVEEADGQATATPGVAPLVLTADCLAIAIAGGGAVAMIHAGWRGLAGGVIGEGVTAVRELGTAGPLRAAMAPVRGPAATRSARRSTLPSLTTARLSGEAATSTFRRSPDSSSPDAASVRCMTSRSARSARILVCSSPIDATRG